MAVSISAIFPNTSESFALDIRNKYMPFDMCFEEISRDFCTDFSGELRLNGVDDIATYVGNYEVTPKATEQRLDTKNKRMTKNLTIHKIPYIEVSNPTGGSTVYIGREVL